MRSCRSISQKQLLSWGQSCLRASRTRTNDASSGSSSRNSLRALTARTLRGNADAHRDDGKRYVVRADERLIAFLELQATIHHQLASSQSADGAGPTMLTSSCSALGSSSSAAHTD